VQTKPRIASLQLVRESLVWHALQTHARRLNDVTCRPVVKCEFPW